MRAWLAVAPPLSDDQVPLRGRDWNQAEVIREVDGDTARLLRRRVDAVLEETTDLGPLVMRDWRVREVEDDVTDFPGGLPGRLVNLDTPESGQPGYREAAADLAHFCDMNAGDLRCITYDQGGGFDRLLIDLYVIEAGYGRYTATEWMLERGWPPYLKGVRRG